MHWFVCFTHNTLLYYLYCCVKIEKKTSEIDVNFLYCGTVSEPRPFGRLIQN